MPTGKLASQACHAAKNVAIMAARQNPLLLDEYQGEDFLGTQIVMKSKNESHLLQAYEEAKEAGLITSLIIDRDHILLPHFTGAPIVTALGIGPATREQTGRILRRFSQVL